ncbi:hypothetical protein HSBAA_PA_2520 (plasmid) [Vreelandella sulfidaeris]|jgi:hypothetical protein|uniref:Uncharacterized protein n=1 Tax=Vreelandella sulfidaeris TaxID=115553 RepID=A0A455UN18_9GAMM|nr:hypothetical protein KO116_P100240 [Halomonas sp. KO116]BBI65649.1 hypothetical protein HSBAA_PA_2520 [Halomonas sulfidaeris]
MTVPYAMKTVMVRQPTGLLAHVGASGGRRTTADVTLKTPRTVIWVLSKHQSIDLLSAITNPTHTLYSMMQSKAQTYALLYVRDRLGHASVATTEKYLHCL